MYFVELHFKKPNKYFIKKDKYINTVKDVITSNNMVILIVGNEKDSVTLSFSMESIKYIIVKEVNTDASKNKTIR